MIAAPVAELHPLHDRCENWGVTYRWRNRTQRALTAGFWSMKRGYGNAWHWDYSDAIDPRGVPLACAPSTRPMPNEKDAHEIEQAVCVLDLFSHTLLRGWHVNRFNPHKCLRLAAKAGGKRAGGFEDALQTAYEALGAALSLPAVIRKDRARERVRAILGPQLQTVED